MSSLHQDDPSDCNAYSQLALHRSSRPSLSAAKGKTVTGFKVLDANGQTLAYVYGHGNLRDAQIAKGLTLDEAPFRKQWRQIKTPLHSAEIRGRTESFLWLDDLCEREREGLF
jgi:hypothetical protein